MTFVYWLHLPEHTSFLSEGYIGVTNYLARRFSTHQKRTQNPHLSNAFKKYGDRIIQTVLLEGPEDYCYDVEEKCRSHDGIGWNVLKGGGRPPILIGDKNPRWGKPCSEDQKRSIIQANKGRPWTEQNKQNQRERMLGSTQSDSTKSKKSKALKGVYVKEKHPMWGSTQSDSTKEKRRKSLLGHVCGDDTRNKIANQLAKSYLVTNPNGKHWEIKNLRKFCRENSLTATSMCNVANGKATHHKGWKVKQISASPSESPIPQISQLLH